MESELKIVAGMGSVDDYEELVLAGADEVFCGFVPHEWNDTFGTLMPLNRREVRFYHVQIGSYAEMEILSKKVQKYGVPVTITFNSLYYTAAQQEMVADMMERLTTLGFESFIVADLGFLLYLAKRGIKANIHMSGEFGEWNRNSLAMISDIYPIRRVIFHRKNTLADMAGCHIEGIEKSIEKEAFFLNEMCHFTGGFCNSLHCDELAHMCMLPYRLVGVKNQDGPTVEKRADDLCDESDAVGSTGCGICALWKLRQAGITHLKIVGRGKAVEGMCEDIRAAVKVRDILSKSASEENFQNNIAMYKDICAKMCYYR